VAKTKFQFRGNVFYVEDVIDQVKSIIDSPDSREKWNKEVEKEKIKTPRYDENVVNCYGKEFIENELKKWESNIKKQASTNIVNHAFSKVMQAGTTRNPFAPDSFDAIDEETIRKTLGKIRSTRKSNVYKNYQALKKF
jgi:transketolase